MRVALVSLMLGLAALAFVLAGSASLRRSPELHLVKVPSSSGSLRSPAVFAGSASLRRSPELQLVKVPS